MLAGASVAPAQNRSHRQMLANDGRAKEASLAKIANGCATDEPPKISPDEAVSLFFGEVMAYWQGDAPQFRRVAFTYSKIAKRDGWPELSDKKLSKLLSENHGCTSRTVNKRDAQGRRLSVVIFPSAEVAP